MTAAAWPGPQSLARLAGMMRMLPLVALAATTLSWPALANAPPTGAVAVDGGVTLSQVELWGAAGVFGFSLFVTMAAFFLRRNAGFSEDAVIRLVSLILIVAGTLFLVTLGYSAEQIAPALGILGTIAGYMLGRSDSAKDKDKDKDKNKDAGKAPPADP